MSAAAGRRAGGWHDHEASSAADKTDRPGRAPPRRRGRGQGGGEAGDAAAAARARCRGSRGAGGRWRAAAPTHDVPADDHVDDRLGAVADAGVEAGATARAPRAPLRRHPQVVRLAGRRRVTRQRGRCQHSADSEETI